MKRRMRALAWALTMIMIPAAACRQGRVVEPLLGTVRSGEAPFNASCPYYTGADGTRSEERCVAGCVATCIEQVLTYWRHPEALTDTLRGWETEHYTIDDIPTATVIDWDNILDDYSGGYTDEQAKAVADLTYYCGVAAHMSWGLESSAASLYRAVEPLWRAFDYQTIAFVQRGLYSDEAWHRLLRNELENGRPVCYTGHNMAMSGHAFNIDGVDEEGRYHLNWGYGGDHDGWFDLDYLNPFEAVDDPTDLGRNEGLFANQTAMFLHPEDFVIDVFDTLSSADALYGVRVDTAVFRRPPDAQGYVVADLTMTNTTDCNLSFTFEALTFLPTDTAVFAQADYVALSSVQLAPGESKVWPVYCQFAKAGERTFAITSDEDTLLYRLPVSVAAGVEPKLTFGAVSHELTAYGDNLTATLTLDARNDASGGTAGNLVTYCLTPKGGQTDTRHWDVLSLPAGETQQLSVTFQHLTDGEEYELLVRCPWTVRQSYTFTALCGEATDSMAGIAEDGTRQSDSWFDLSGRRVERPVRGVYIKRGKKVLIR